MNDCPHHHGAFKLLSTHDTLEDLKDMVRALILNLKLLFKHRSRDDECSVILCMYLYNSL